MANLNNASRRQEFSGKSQQQRYVPVVKARSESGSGSTSTSNVADSNRSAVDAADGSGISSRVRIGDNGDWVPTSRGGKFVNYLPQDEAVAVGFGADQGGLDSIESQRVVDLLNRELSTLLKLNPRDFWRQVASDTSLHDFLDSYLQFRYRWYDFPRHSSKGVVAGVVVGEFALSRRVLLLLYRISSNRDLGAKASDSLSPTEHAALLQAKKLLDLPKLLDICAIYGHDNKDLVSSMVANAIKAQPRIHDDFTAVTSQFISIGHTMHQRCKISLEVLLSSDSFGDDKPNRLHADYLEVMDFINDSVLSMDSFVSAYKPAAVVFSCPLELSFGNEELLTTLATLHNSLLPCLLHGFRMIYMDHENNSRTLHKDTLSEIAVSIKMISNNLVNFAWNLLEVCYLSDEVFQSDLHLPDSTKMFPPMIEDSAIRADILIQTLTAMNDMQHIELNHNIGTFLENMDQKHDLLACIANLHSAGWISVDDEQFQFLSKITKHQAKLIVKNSSGVSSSSNAIRAQMGEDTAILESKISQIKDLFPEYGKGYLSACLEVYNHDPEEVIQRILEGTLHADLQSLDTTLDKVPAKAAAPSAGKKDKGKGLLVEPAMPSIHSSSSVGEWYTENQSATSASVGRFVRKSRVDSTSSADLNTRYERDLAKTAALVSQYEYDDEYDDSFDDLGLGVGDTGLEENESFREKLRSSDVDSNLNPSDSARWGSRKKPQYYVKDGKNYSYKVEGAVAVANTSEASLVNQAQREMIHGLGRGGNLPLGAVKKLEEIKPNDRFDANESGGRGGQGSHRGRGRRGGRGSLPPNEAVKPNDNEGKNDQPGSGETGERGNSAVSRGRGRGRGGGGHNHNRRDQSMKKHFSGLSGY